MSEKKEKKTRRTKKQIGAEALNDPAVAEMIAQYKEIAARWNHIANNLAGRTKLAENVSEADHVVWLQKIYCHDVLFMLRQLGIVNVVENPNAEQTNVEPTVEVVNEDETTAS